MVHDNNYNTCKYARGVLSVKRTKRWVGYHDTNTKRYSGHTGEHVPRRSGIRFVWSRADFSEFSNGLVIVSLDMCLGSRSK